MAPPAAWLVYWAQFELEPFLPAPGSRETALLGPSGEFRFLTGS